MHSKALKIQIAVCIAQSLKFLVLYALQSPQNPQCCMHCKVLKIPSAVCIAQSLESLVLYHTYYKIIRNLVVPLVLQSPQNKPQCSITEPLESLLLCALQSPQSFVIIVSQSHQNPLCCMHCKTLRFPLEHPNQQPAF